ncbi:MAG TPA: DUF427 domain-containing protein [Phenylobacterium sp.]
MTDVSSGARIRTERPGRRWRAQFAGHVIADSPDACILYETGHQPVVYFPRSDVSMEYMSRTDRMTHCPYKGEASHYTLLMDGHFAENAVWSYEDPIDGMEAIKGCIAFYPGQVEVYEVDEAVLHNNDDADRHGIDQTIQHTDSGSGASQKDHWPPNVAAPEA